VSPKRPHASQSPRPGRSTSPSPAPFFFPRIPPPVYDDGLCCMCQHPPPGVPHGRPLLRSLPFSPKEHLFLSATQLRQVQPFPPGSVSCRKGFSRPPTPLLARRFPPRTSTRAMLNRFPLFLSTARLPPPPPSPLSSLSVPRRPEFPPRRKATGSGLKMLASPFFFFLVGRRLIGRRPPLSFPRYQCVLIRFHMEVDKTFFLYPFPPQNCRKPPTFIKVFFPPRPPRPLR